YRAVTPVTDAALYPHLGELVGCVAARVARIGPVLAVEVEVLRGEEIHWQGLHARRRRFAAVGLGLERWLGQDCRGNEAAREQQAGNRHRYSSRLVFLVVLSQVDLAGFLRAATGGHDLAAVDDAGAT